MQKYSIFTSSVIKNEVRIRFEALLIVGSGPMRIRNTVFCRLYQLTFCLT
jgi:hypothetical protein